MYETALDDEAKQELYELEESLRRRLTRLALLFCLLTHTGCALAARVNDYVDEDHSIHITERTAVFKTWD